MGSIKGADKHAARLRRMRGPKFARAVNGAVFKEAQDVQVDAQISITTGAVSGANHVASLPGEPPNNDSGVLAGNIEATNPAPLKGETSSNAPYALPLEYGSEANNLAERPYMRPAAQKSRARFPGRIADVVQKVVRSGA